MRWMQEWGSSFPRFYYAANQNSVSDLKRHVAKFEASLSAYMLLSVFSFFEAFVKAIIDELIEFHGGIETMIRRAERRDKRFIAKITKEMSIQRYKLREKKKLGRGDRYRKYTRTLEGQGFRFPTETFSSYGVRKFAEDISRLKAHAIPDFLIHALHVPLDPSDVRYFHRIRKIRNDIAHGNTVALDLGEISKVNDLFRRWTLLTEEHLLTNYFIIEDYS